MEGPHEKLIRSAGIGGGTRRVRVFLEQQQPRAMQRGSVLHAVGNRRCLQDVRDHVQRLDSILHRYG